jgi:diguanylate cyclase (GGDEF)-like protein
MRLIAVGIVVLASLLYAGAVQVTTRTAQIASYTVGLSAVRLVERMRDVTAALGSDQPVKAWFDDRRIAMIRSGLADVVAGSRDPALAGAFTNAGVDKLEQAWDGLGSRRPDPSLVRLTNEALRESLLRVGTIAVTRGSAASSGGILAEATLLALPVANANFQRLSYLLTVIDPGRAHGPFARASLTTLYSEARLASNVALDGHWIDALPAANLAQARAARAATSNFLDLLHMHLARNDAFTYKFALVGPGAEAARSLAIFQQGLLPLLETNLADAQDRAQREIALIVALVTAIISVVVLLSLQVLRSQARSRRARAAFQHQAMHDALTGLPNRRAFTQAAAAAVAAWTPVNDRTNWILSIDLDYFKEVNDRYGHQAGDAFLVAAAQRLASATPAGDLLARVGGDEFAIIVHHYDPDSSHAQHVGDAICAAFADPIDVEGVEHRLAASIGIVAIDALHETVDSVLRDADIAMYRAKEDGGDRVVVFDDALRQTIIDRAELASDLRAALERDTGPRVVFQPILVSDDRSCYGFEALVRWRHPMRGEVDSSMLIDVAQEARLIVPLGRRVMHEVCRHLAAWRDQGLVLDNLSIHINVSPMEASHPATAASLGEAMSRWNIPPHALVIELTETASIESMDTTTRFLAKLHEMGVRVCLDDFGTGYSSLQHLNDFAIDAIKVDRSFVVSAADDPAKVPIVAGIIALARGLKAEVITEGIETVEQRELIDHLGCRLVQGYLFARPMPAEDALTFALRSTSVAQPVAPPIAI